MTLALREAREAGLIMQRLQIAARLATASQCPLIGLLAGRVPDPNQSTSSYIDVGTSPTASVRTSY
ncbi:hypothetical protein [Cupriavidus sp. UYPR2.512]|uniref:hypothetical protein n=1 Tax=Cupriavidus sp. UYPR2.512 TaxID=1080187 RepID=UPI00037AF88E|nr:hypothetical protein [Cupriavidus sp. UYPR2.512]